MNDITWAGVLSTASDLVFSGGREGYFYALDGKTGNLLWKQNLGGQVNSGPMSYAVNGRQYIATPTGWQGSLIGSATAALFPEQQWRMGSTLVVFALPR
jgi:alcohol dehydrogenase (cytochrome c)